MHSFSLRWLFPQQGGMESNYCLLNIASLFYVVSTLYLTTFQSIWVSSSSYCFCENKKHFPILNVYSTEKLEHKNKLGMKSFDTFEIVFYFDSIARKQKKNRCWVRQGK